MTEDEAKSWIAHHFGEAGSAAMEQLVSIVLAEATEQNLIAPSTLPQIWSRHVVDSAQLIQLAKAARSAASSATGTWLDIGSGAGFPGLVVAALTKRTVLLVEPRKRRADFLSRAAMTLGVADRASIACDRIEAVSVTAEIISARAVAPLVDLFAWAGGCATSTTQWILPKGRSARDEVASARRAWKGVFHVEHSLTDPESLIVLASGVARR